MSSRLGAIFLTLCFSAGCLTSVAYDNPVIPGFHPDPSVVRVGEDYWLVTSSFCYFPGVPIFHSTDLVNWELKGNVLNRPSQLPLKGASVWLGIYAPTIRHHDGRYYMITTNVPRGGNFLVHTTDPEGEWSDPVWLEQQGIDPSLFFADDGTCYMVSNPDNTIMLSTIDPLTGRQLTPSKPLWQGTGGRYPEAPHIYHRDGWYYLMISEGGTEHGHGVTVARSRSIDGPYESNPSNPILTHFSLKGQTNPIQGTGHADLVEAPDGSWWLVCLAFRYQDGAHHLLGRETYLAPVSWSDDGWPVVNGDGTISLDMAIPGAPAQHKEALNAPYATDFSDYPADPSWVWLRNPVDCDYFSDAAGLHIKATPVDPSDTSASPSMLLRRLQHERFNAQTAVKLQDAAPGTSAGLTVHAAEASHYDVALRRNSLGKQEVALVYRLNNLRHEEAVETLPDGTASVVLRVEGTPELYHFSYSADGGTTFRPLGSMNTRYLSTETAGGFTGTLVGLFSRGEGGEGVFENFQYTPHIN